MKIRILKDLPWAKVGETITLNDEGDWRVRNSFNWWVLASDIITLADTGWIEIVEEKKTLEQELIEVGLGDCESRDIVEICREHFLDALPKSLDAFDVGIIGACRKAIQEAK